jgi:membrane protease YdiL (CAAX protease family)
MSDSAVRPKKTVGTKDPVKAPVPKLPKITWGPMAAIFGTIFFFFSSQLVGSILLEIVAHLRGLSGDQVTQWLEKTGPQFFYIAIVEGTVLGLLWIFLKHRHATFKTLGMIKPKLRDLGWALTGFGIYFPVLFITTIAIRAWFPSIDLQQQQQVGFQSAHGFFPLLLVFVSLVILPPLAEEILSRGFLYLGLKSKLPVIWAAIVTSVIFAAAHLQFGSGAPLLWSAAIDTFILSLVLIYVREKTGALWASIGLHMIKNGLAFCILFIFAK